MRVVRSRTEKILYGQLLVNMETNSQKLKKIICDKKEDEFLEVLRSGLDPNFEGGWPIRLAARFGCTTIVEKLLQFGANPHLLSNSGKLNLC